MTPHAGRKLLVIDDDASNRITLTALLEHEGFVVDDADSLALGRDLLVPDAPYAVVVLDVHLGDGSGLDLIPDIRERCPAAKVVLVSGTGLGVDGGRADAFLIKDGDFDKLLESIEGLLVE